jgi:hypothetical protein
MVRATIATRTIHKRVTSRLERRSDAPSAPAPATTAAAGATATRPRIVRTTAVCTQPRSS